MWSIFFHLTQAEGAGLQAFPPTRSFNCQRVQDIMNEATKKKSVNHL